MGREILVHFLLPFLPAVLLGTGYGVATKGNGCACTGSVEYLFAAIRVLGGVLLGIVGQILVTLLTEGQLSIQLVRNFLARRIQGVQVVVVRVAHFIIGAPHWNVAIVGVQRLQHIVHTVHALLPTELLILSVLVALHRVQHAALHAPFLSGIVISHGACGVLPCSSFILYILSVRCFVGCPPVVVLDIVCLYLGECLVKHMTVFHGHLTYLCHGSGTIVLNEARFRTTELTQHIQRARYQ